MERLYNAIMGAVIGDALGVPVEFMERDTYKITGMTGYGTYNQPPGTWSDDSSMIIATLASIVTCGTVDHTDIMQNFYSWFQFGKFTPYNECFDIGGATRRAIVKYKNGMDPDKCGGNTRMDNGNGGLMRILPVSILYPNKAVGVSCLTHAHTISRISCFIYTEVVQNLFHGIDKYQAVQNAYAAADQNFKISERSLLADFWFLDSVSSRKRDEIKSTGYVVDTLEAALWCLMKGANYRDVVLLAVNLGGDTDTIACIAGGLAGLIYGDLPEDWVLQIPRREYIKELCDKAVKSSKN